MAVQARESRPVHGDLCFSSCHSGAEPGIEQRCAPDCRRPYFGTVYSMMLSSNRVLTYLRCRTLRMTSGAGSAATTKSAPRVSAICSVHLNMSTHTEHAD